MKWLRLVLLSAPFLVALVLTVLISIADRFHLNLQHVAAYGFLFSTPWAWLLDGWFPGSHNKTLGMVLDLAIILWIPAALYSGCIWLLFFAFRKLRRKTGTR